MRYDSRITLKATCRVQLSTAAFVAWSITLWIAAASASNGAGSGVRPPEAVAQGSTATGRTCPLPPRPHENGRLFGINLAGAEFAAEIPRGQFGKDYTYPTAEDLHYYYAKGFRLVRLPFLWERLQPALFGAFDEAELGRLDHFVSLALDRGMAVVIGPHNYARYRVANEPVLIGNPAVPISAFVDFWHRLATHFKARPDALAFSLMNEPHDTGGTWGGIAQAGLDAIRRAGSNHTVYVPGDGWSGAWRWKQFNARLILNDPLNRLVYDAHQYFDRNGSGFYQTGYDQSGAFPTIAVERVKPFVSWLRQHGLRGAITEYGVPNDDPRWLVVLDNLLAEMRALGLSGTYWAGGPWWGPDYPLSSEPRNGTDAPVMRVLTKYLDRCPKP
jgi:aryl-phospho-beta-D-glucosidase BglC (GH1 family)